MKTKEGLLKIMTGFLKRPEVELFLGWLTAVHIFQMIVFPSLMIPTQVLANYALKTRMIQIWSSSADTAHYIQVALNGYSRESFVFFPLWPLILKLFHADPLISKVISCILTLIFLVLFAKLIRLWNFKIALPEILLIYIAFPFSIMLLMPMSEPLYLVLATGGILAAERKRYFTSAMLIALATATRMIGVVLVVYFLLKLISDGKAVLKKYWLAILISPLGIVIYSLYLQIVYGDFSLFYKQETQWNRSLGLQSLQKLFQESTDIIMQIVGSYKPVPINLLHFGSVFLFLVLALYAYKKLNIAAWIYCILSITIPLLSGTFLGVPRYLLAAFPLFIPFGMFLRNHKILYFSYIALSFMFQSYLLIRFFNFEMVA